MKKVFSKTGKTPVIKHYWQEPVKAHSIHNAFIEITKQTLIKALFKAPMLFVCLTKHFCLYSSSNIQRNWLDSLILVYVLAYKFQESLPKYF